MLDTAAKTTSKTVKTQTIDVGGTSFVYRELGPRGDSVRGQRIQPSTRAEVSSGGENPVNFCAGAVLAGVFAKLDHAAIVGPRIAAENR